MMTGSEDVHAAPLHMDGQGTARWSSDVPAAVAAVVVEIVDGAMVTVDAAEPERVLSWFLATGTDPRVLTDTFADADLAQQTAVAVTAGSGGVPLATPTLTPVWARIAEVVSVDQVLPAGVDESLLELDEALARYAAGQHLRAIQLFTSGYPTLLLWGDRAASGSLDDYATDRVRHLLQTVAGSGVDGRVLERLKPFLDVLEAAHREDEQRSDQMMEQWLKQLTANQLVGAMDMGVRPTGADDLLNVSIGTAKIDMEMVEVRVLRWAGPDEDEVTYRFHHDTDQLEIDVPLAEHTDHECDEVDKLMVYLAARESGRILLCMPTVVVDRKVHAEFKVPGWDPIDHVIGVFDSDNPLRDLQADELGQNLAHFRRKVLESWRLTRNAREVLSHTRLSMSPSLVARGKERYEQLTAAAQRHAHGALKILRDLVGDQKIDILIRQQLSREQDVLELYTSRLHPKDSLPATEPLLAEVLWEQ